MATVVTINGVVIDRSQYTLSGGTLYQRGGIPSFVLGHKGGKLADKPDWDNLSITIEESGVLIFGGRTASHTDNYDEAHYGWVREWQCAGLLQYAARVPVTDPVSLTDTIVYNASQEDGPVYLSSRAGRSVGQIWLDILEIPDHSAALAARGIGQFTSSGSGARATATMVGGQVTGATVVAGGTGYSTAPSVFFSGGSPTVAATGHCTVTGGVVAGIVIDTPGSGYRSTPTVILSRLPAATLADLDQLAIVPPQRFTVAGESVLQALAGASGTYYPNHNLSVDPDGAIRYRDPRTYPADIALILGCSTPRVGKPSLTRDWSGSYSRVLLRGNTLVSGLKFHTTPWPGSADPDGGATEAFQHDGLTSAQAKAVYTPADWTSPSQPWGRATATANLSGNVVSTITVGVQGYSYAAAPAVLLSGGGGSGATATATLGTGASAGKVVSITVTNGGAGYTTPPTVSVAAPGTGQSVLGTCTQPNTTTLVITPTDRGVQWPADYWAWTESGHLGNVNLRSDTIAGITKLHSARVVTNTALVPGGTCQLTIDVATPDLSFGSFELIGTGSGNGLVYRKYKIADPFGSRIQQVFPYPVPYRSGDSLAATLTSNASATVRRSASGQPPYAVSAIGIASIDPDSGTVITDKPTCFVFSNTVPPVVTPVNDVEFFLPIATGVIETVWPPDSGGTPQYAGTSFTMDGIADTKLVTCREWRDNSNRDNMTLWAKELHGSLCDTVIEGSVPYFGLLPAALTEGHSLTLSGEDYATPWDGLPLPIVSCSIAYNEGMEGPSYTMSLGVSNRRQAYSGAAFVRPTMVGMPVGLATGFFSFGKMADVGGGKAIVPGMGGGPETEAAYKLAGLARAGDREAYKEELGKRGVTMGEAVTAKGAPAAPTAADLAASTPTPAGFAAGIPTTPGLGTSPADLAASLGAAGPQWQGGTGMGGGNGRAGGGGGRGPAVRGRRPTVTPGAVRPAIIGPRTPAEATRRGQQQARQRELIDRQAEQQQGNRQAQDMAINAQSEADRTRRERQQGVQREAIRREDVQRGAGPIRQQRELKNRAIAARNARIIEEAKGE